MVKIIHIITSLDSGGAENMLLKLLTNIKNEDLYHEVITLRDKGTIGPQIEQLGIKVHEINLNVFKIIQNLKKVSALCNSFDIIDTWLYHSDIIGLIFSKCISKKKVIWNIRHSNLKYEENKKLTLFLVKINAFLSRYVELITFNSNESKSNHEKFGYRCKESIVIYNGFDLVKFQKNDIVRKKLRCELGLAEDEITFITVGRWYIQKDYPTMIKALSYLKKSKKVRFKLIMCGTGLCKSNTELMKLIKDNALDDNVILLGRRDDIPELLSSADLYLSSSIGESFSNSIGEAMACELPCIVTNVGESRFIVGDTGKIVCEKDPKSLYFAIIDFIGNNELGRLGKLARERISSNFEINNISKKYENVIFKLMDKE